ncbi:IS3 family transposase [Streptomyces sp. NPDC055709]
MHRESDGTYSAPRITAEPRETGELVNHKRVAGVMRSISLAGVRLRRRHRTTVADPAAAKAPDLIGRDLTAITRSATTLNKLTYLPLESGKFLYLATVIDLASHRLAGWAIADHMRTELVTDALGRRDTNPRQPGRSGHAHRSRSPAHLCRLRCRLQGGWHPPIHERNRQLGGQRARRVLQRDIHTRDAPGPKGWSSEREARLDTFRWLHHYNARRHHSRLGQHSPIT